MPKAHTCNSNDGPHDRREDDGTNWEIVRQWRCSVCGAVNNEVVVDRGKSS